MSRAAVVTLGALLALLPAAAAAAQTPRYGPAIKLDPRGGTEPRVAVAANDHRLVVTNREADGQAALFRSTDRGESWKEAGDPFPGQNSTTIDVDVVAMAGGRILATELDSAGLNFPTAVSDDEGATWIASSGSNQMADQDRQFVAVGPPDAGAEKPVVHMTWHNLASGSGVHNVFVSTSHDGGETFDPPVPVTVPGDPVFADLQCAAGYPSSIAVNPRTGQVYVFFISRAASVGGLETGGCGASVFGPFEINIIAATRIWVATSPDGSAGSWTQSLAVDRSQTGQIVAMQFAPGTLDNQGNPWVVFPESPRPYPDYSGASINVVHADPEMKEWSKPSTLVPAGGAGNLLTHIAVGDPGKVAVAYLKGEGEGEQTAWFPHVVTSDGNDQRLSDVAPYMGTASSLEGACSAEGPTQGIENGLTCNRAPDNFGIALDADCRLTVTWPGESNARNEDAAGTWVATQLGGRGLCGEASQQGGSGAPVGPFCRDATAPRAQLARKRARATRRGLRLAGRTSDRGCDGQQPDRPVTGTVARVQVAVARALGHARRAWLDRRARAGKPVSCLRGTPRWLAAKGTRRWTFRLKRKLKAGSYRVVARAVDRSGNVSASSRAITLRVR